MWKYLCCFVLCVLCCLAAAEPQAPSKPATVKPDYSKEAFICEQASTKIIFENDGTSTREASTRIRIQSDAGVQRFSVITFSYQNANESVDIDYVRVKKPDGTVVTTPPDSTQDMAAEITRQAPFYSDLREKHVAVKGLSVGDVLEYTAHWHTTKPLAPGQFWYAYNFGHDEIILEEVLQISVPRDRAVKWKSPSVKPVITEDAAHRTFTWTTSQLEQKSSEQKDKQQEENAYNAARGKSPAPDLQISTFQTWDEIGRWYQNLQQDRVKPSDEIRAKAAELTKNAADDNAKLHAIYHYVSTEFHYIGVAFGIGRYQPHAAAEVLANQYGDCKDKHTLLASLLEAAGIKAYPALINSSREIDPDVPSPAQFDHMITAVPQGSSFTWLDTTTEVAPFGYLLSILRDKQALVIAPNKPAALVSTPADPPVQPVEVFTLEAKLNESGTLEGKIDWQLTGTDAELIFRAAFRRIPLTQWRDLAQQMARVEGYGGDVSDVTASPPEKTDEPFRLSYTYNRKDFPDWEHRRVVSGLPPIGVRVLDTKPSTPIWFGSPQQVRYVSHIQLPKGYSPDLPANLNLTEDFAEYHAAYSTKDGVLTTERSLKTKLPEIPASRFEAYKAFAKAVGDDYDRYVNVSSTGMPTIPAANPLQQAIANLPMSDNAEAMTAFNDALQQTRVGNMDEAVSALQRAVQADPHFARAWLMIAALEAAKGQRETSLDMLRQAHNADPHESVIYKALTSALVSEKKYDEAVSLLQDLVKSEPPNYEIFSTLASTLFLLKRYDEAAAEVQSAIKLAPDRAGLYQQLGVAYLHGGKQDDATAAFKKAVELDPSPLMLNDVGYEMADAGGNLTLSLEYAQKAVHSEEEASAAVVLADLKNEDLRHTTSLAAYWDTLGWVYFRMGNLDQAEKYLNAAWVLSQDGVIGDHLGQVYEKRHNKEAAVHMYRLALSVSPSVASVSAFMTDVQAKIARLGGTDKPLFEEVDELNKLRTIKLPRVAPGQANAEFFLQFDSGPKVKDVRFISGSDKLKSAGKQLALADFHVLFPDNGPASLVRRGILGCYPSTGCSFVFIKPTDVHSVN